MKITTHIVEGVTAFLVKVLLRPKVYYVELRLHQRANRDVATKDERLDGGTAEEDLIQQTLTNKTDRFLVFFAKGSAFGSAPSFSSVIPHLIGILGRGNVCQAFPAPK